MNRNAKIALGCGGGGCLGLILIVIVFAVLVVSGVIKAPGLYSSSSNSNDNYNYNSNSNSNFNSNTNLNSNSNTSNSSSTMSEDDKHKLLQAAGMANDNDLMPKVLRKLGFITDAGVSDDYAQFIKDHASWAQRNIAFINSMRQSGAALAYVNEHLND
jgi:predicted PurR-regulated permease PerM